MLWLHILSERYWVSTTAGRDGFGGVFVEIGRERDAGSLEDVADLSGNGGA